MSRLKQPAHRTGVRNEDDYESHAEYRERILNLLKLSMDEVS